MKEHQKVMEFLKDLLTDRIDNIKVDALSLYTQLIEADCKKEQELRDAQYSGNVLTLILPNSGNKFQINLSDYDIIKNFMIRTEKINAIKHLRQFGKMMIPSNDYPNNPYVIGLKEAKDFCEQHFWN